MLRRVAVVAGWIAASAAALWASLSFHYFHHDRGRDAARWVITRYSTAVLKGRVEVDGVSVVDTDRIVMHGWRIYGPGGDLVVDTDQVTVDPDWGGFLSGEIRYESGTYRGAEIWIRPGPR